MHATILNIQRFSTHDGPGIRTTVFFKGCTNACVWCHNPESLHATPELQLFPDRCIGCGRCLDVCTVGAHENLDGVKVFHRDRCAGCGRCAEECFAQAIVLAGKQMTVDELMAEIVKDDVYYRQSGGGATFSGGEPVLAGEFLTRALKKCKAKGIHRILQTAGNYPWSKVEPMLPYLDLVMFDFKLWDATKHERYVGTRPEPIRENLTRMAETGIPLIVRTPVVGGVNDASGEIEAIAGFLSGLRNVKRYELLPYHALGNSKRATLGLGEAPAFEVPSKKHMEALAAAANSFLPTVTR